MNFVQSNCFWHVVSERHRKPRNHKLNFPPFTLRALTRVQKVSPELSDCRSKPLKNDGGVTFVEKKPRRAVPKCKCRTEYPWATGQDKGEKDFRQCKNMLFSWEGLNLLANPRENRQKTIKRQNQQEKHKIKKIQVAIGNRAYFRQLCFRPSVTQTSNTSVPSTS